MSPRSPRAQALYAALTTALTTARGAAVRDPGLEVLADAELHADGELVLAALRALIHDDDPEVFRTLLPFAAHRWAGGWLAFEACPCPERGALLAEWLAATMPGAGPAARAWPRLGDPPGPPPEPELERGPEMVRAMVERLWPGLGPDERSRLHAIAVALYDRAGSVGAREDAARLRLAMGDTEHLPELRASAIASLRELGMSAWLARDVEAAVVELGPLVADDLGRPGDAERRASLDKILARAEQLALALDPRTGLVVYCQIGGPPARGDRWCLGRWSPATGEWVDRLVLDPGPEVELGPAQRPQLRFAKSAKRGAFVVEYQDRTGELLRHHFAPGSEGHDGAWRHGSRASDLSGAAPKPELPAKPARTTQTTRTKPATNAKAARYQVRRVGRGPGAHEGRMAVPGQHHVGIHDTERDAIILAPPDAIAIAVAGDDAVVWAQRRRPGCSGVARGDYDWVIEIWSLAANTPVPARQLSDSCGRVGTGPVGPLASHTVADRELVGWCWPDKLTCAARTRHRIIRLSCRSEDDRVDLYLVRRDAGPWLETRDRQQALAAQ